MSKKKTHFSKVVLKAPKILHKDFGKDGDYGGAYKNDNMIEINIRQPSEEWLNTYCHEMGHQILPDLEEPEIEKFAKILSEGLWKNGWRRIAK